MIFKALKTITIVSVLSLSSLSAIAHDGVEMGSEMSARHYVMKSVASAASVAVPMLKGGEFDKNAATLAAASMAAAGNAFPYLFTIENAGDEGTKASANIWSDKAGFDAISLQMANAGHEAYLAAKAGDEDGFKAAFGEAMKTCRACHSKYREK